jgi:hypothetical protein
MGFFFKFRMLNENRMRNRELCLQARQAEASKLAQQLAEFNLQNHQDNIQIMLFSEKNLLVCFMVCPILQAGVPILQAWPAGLIGGHAKLKPDPALIKHWPSKT